jgi:hypothetical protein
MNSTLSSFWLTFNNIAISAVPYKTLHFVITYKKLVLYSCVLDKNKIY